MILKKTDKSYFDQPNRAHNIIIYCGDEHADNYRGFLSSMAFHDITYNLTKIPNIAKNCLDMRKIKQPFFRKTLTETLTETPETLTETPPK